MADRTVSVALVAKMGSFNAGMTSAKMSTKEFGGELDRLRQRGSGQFREIGAGAATVGIAMAGLAGWAIKAGMDFDKAMSEVKAITHATAEEMGQLRTAALEAGKSTVFSATEAATAQAELAKAGLSTADILGGGLKGALSLAAAGSLDLAEAADVAAKAMNMFGLEGKDVSHVADLLAGGANATSTDVHELGEALKMGGGAAHAAGLSFEETVTTLGALTKGALVGSDAGTSLKTMMIALSNPTDKSSKLMKELGINAYDASGKFVGMYALADDLQESLGGLTQQQRNAALATIFGADAMRAATVLYEQGAEGLQGVNKQILAQADAAATAAEKTDNLAGDLERLIGSLETLAIEAGEGANGGLRWLAQSLDSLVGEFSDLPNWVQESIVVLAGLSGASLLVVAGMLKVKGVLGGALQAMRDIGPAGEAAAKGIGRVGKAIGAVTVVGTGILLGYELVKWLTENSAAAAVEVEGLTKSLNSLAATGRLTGDLAKVFGENWSKLQTITTGLRQATEPMREFDAAAADAMNSTQNLNAEMRDSHQAVTDADKAWQDFKGQIPEVDQALKGLVENGGAAQAAMAFDLIKEKWVASGRPLKELTDLLPEYAGAMQAANAANSGAAKGFGDAHTNAILLADGLEEAISKGQSLYDVFNRLNGATLGLSEAQIKAEEAIDTFNKAMDESSGSLDINTEAGRKSQTALNNIAKAAADVAQATYAKSFATKGETGALADAKAAYDGYLKKAKDAVKGTEGHKAAVRRLIDEVSKLPDLKTTKVDVKIRVTVNDATDGVLRSIEARLSRLSGMAARIGRYADTGIGAKGGTALQGASAPAAKRASGGPINIGQSYEVGERGPEVITATRNMYVNPYRPPVPVQSGPVVAHVNEQMLGRVVADQVRTALQGVAVVMDGQRVGVIQGRYADLLQRGG